MISSLDSTSLPQVPVVPSSKVDQLIHHDQKPCPGFDYNSGEKLDGEDKGQIVPQSFYLHISTATRYHIALWNHPNPVLSDQEYDDRARQLYTRFLAYPHFNVYRTKKEKSKLSNDIWSDNLEWNFFRGDYNTI